MSEHVVLGANDNLQAQYIDNIIVGCNKRVVDAAIGSAIKALHRHNLTTHGELGLTDATALGLHFHICVNSVGVNRGWRVRFALEILRLGYASGPTMETLMGHFASAALLRRESLSVGNAVYAFGNNVGPYGRPSRANCVG